jgi:integrase
MSRRKSGHASIEEHPKGSGKYRVRARINGKLTTIANGLPKAEAQETADAYAVIRNEDVLREGLTLTQFGLGFFQRRERRGVRGWRKDKSRWKARIDQDPIGNLPVSTLGRRDVVEWLDRQQGKHQTLKNALNLLRVALAEAVDRELLESNPARDVKVHRSLAATDEDDLEGILVPDEQRKLLEAVPEKQRPLVAFALLTGLRQAEQWWLRHEDIGDGFIMVRRSVGGKPPKGGRPRRAHLLEPARRALELAPHGSPWVWPALRGGRRSDGKAPKGWHQWVKAAGIKRRIRWQDLRHTCATSLLAGWWGRKWSLDEVCSHLGHSSVTVTERYARKLQDTHRLAVAGTLFPESSPLMLPAGAKQAKKPGSQLGDLNPRPAVYEGAPSSSSSGRLLGGKFPRGNIEAKPGAWALALAAESLGIGQIADRRVA